jgi:hypothetical protein
VPPFIAARIPVRTRREAVTQEHRADVPGLRSVAGEGTEV